MRSPLGGDPFRPNPWRRLKTIGIAGSRGKTVASCLVAAVLHAAGHRVGVANDLGVCDGREATGDRADPATPAAWADLLRRMADNDCSHAVLELPAEALGDGSLIDAELDAACVTNTLGDLHHRSLCDDRRTAGQLLDLLAPEGFASLNADDAATASWLGQFGGPVLTVAIRRAGEIMATIVEQTLYEQTFLLIAGSDVMPVTTRMVGTHHVYNCLSAAAIGLAYGIDLPTVVRGLESVDHVPSRLQRLECGQPFGVFVDAARSPDTLAGALACLRKWTCGRLIAVVGCGNEWSAEQRPLVGKVVENAADLAFLTGSRQGRAAAGRLVDDVLGGFACPASAEVQPRRAAAIELALDEAREGDCLLVVGDDVENVRTLLYESQARGTLSGLVAPGVG